VSSLFNKIIHRKSSTNNLPSESKPGVETSPSITMESNLGKEKNNSVTKPIKHQLETPQLIVGVSQSVGIQRDHNEDALFSLTSNLASDDSNKYFGLFIVADGMGGHENGEIASRIAVGELSSFVINNIYLPLFSTSSNQTQLSIHELLRSGVVQAHQSIKREAMGGGTTLTAVMILGDQMISAHVGDSRLYSIDTDGINQLLTHDHSLVKRLEEIGQISSEQASTHPQRNVLYRALGQGDPVEPDIATFPCKPGNILILCSDGLWGVVPDKDMTEIILSIPEPQVACQTLIQKANAAGGPDNISVIIIRIPE
jgi:serine/threonine protein phosphatase PrpC